MIVVSDTSPLTALLKVGKTDLLKTLFQEVIIPQAVRDELLRSHALLPDWLHVIAVSNRHQADQFAEIVDLGEAEAITLALELHANLLLIDERKGRRLAAQKGIPVIGLLGVVLLARRKRLIPSARA
jgi:uncharacterized protein